jgi:tetratricopeptide (TPR) repeat protein
MAACVAAGLAAAATPYVPANDADVLAQVPIGATHRSSAALQGAVMRLDVAMPLAQFDISRARATGDLRFLGYAEAALSPWLKVPDVDPQVHVLDATILQSRHSFDASLVELDRALKQNPADPQAWLTRATVLRVLGRYDEAAAACERLRPSADPAVTSLCLQGLKSLTGHLDDAYQAIKALSPNELDPTLRAWRYSELGEMSERRGDAAGAEHWFREGLEAAPDDLYLRAAFADSLLLEGRNADTLTLLAGYDSMEPMLLRIAIAHHRLNDGAGGAAESTLQGAFDVELQRGDAVHRREQARFLLDVRHDPEAALAAALQNWRVQREPDDILIVLRAAREANQPAAAAPALRFLEHTGLEDRRMSAYKAAT